MVEIRSKVVSYPMNGLGTRLATKWLIHYLDVDSTMKVKTFSENVPFLQMFSCVMPAMSLHITSFSEGPEQDSRGCHDVIIIMWLPTAWLALYF